MKEAGKSIVSPRNAKLGHVWRTKDGQYHEVVKTTGNDIEPSVVRRDHLNNVISGERSPIGMGVIDSGKKAMTSDEKLRRSPGVIAFHATSSGVKRIQ